MNMKKKPCCRFSLPFAALFALALAVGCNCDKTKLYQTWVLEKYGPENALKTVITGNPPAKPEILLTLTDTGQFNGTDGCNSIFGTYTADKYCKIQFGGINSTLIFCTGEGIMEQAAAVTNLLRNANRYEVTDTQLKLCTPAKETLLYHKK
jgi:heat shock protein HslJ